MEFQKSLKMTADLAINKMFYGIDDITLHFAFLILSRIIL